MAPPKGKAVAGTQQAILSGMAADNTVRRIWEKDPSVWRKDPSRQGELRNRLGWLDAAHKMLDQVDDLAAFAHEVQRDGIRQVVLLGMGGSSLCPEVLRITFGNAKGSPELTVLDSTVPAAVARITAGVDPAAALFIVSSKSGTTTEPLAFFSHFHELTERKVGVQAGKHFVAITDPGTPLESLARRHGFRRVFSADADVGGRYSALTHFGIVPAALIGLDFERLLKRGQHMAERCGPDTAAEDNPGAVLGAFLGHWYHEGRDKLTFVTSPKLASFGLWAEQLIAESTGKEGRGILPIANEPFADVSAYGADRVFAYLRLEGDRNSETDTHVARLEQAGHPVRRIELPDLYHLGAEFFRWEFATAVAGAIIGIHPFDQPNVQQSKDNTVRVLAEFQAAGQLPAPAGGPSPAELLAGAQPGDYLVIMAYIDQTPAADAVLGEFRRRALERRHLASTLGYGPRFLHSTGQLHKGGKPNGLFLQIVGGGGEDIPLAGQPYGFHVLSQAQAIGDLQALQAGGRRVARVALGADVENGLKRLVESAQL